MEKNTLNSVNIDSVYKFNNRYLIYSLAKRKSNKLFIVFSALSPKPGYNLMSYYALQKQLQGNVLHIMDNFGAHGCYLLSTSKSIEIQNAVLSLIKEVINTNNISKDNIYFLGTSKGGTMAILYSLMLGYGTAIVGEPQIKLGNFLFRQNWENIEEARSLIYVMTGKINIADKEYLNALIEDIFKNYGDKFKGKIHLLVGKKTGYFENHIVYFNAYCKQYNIKTDKVDIILLDISTHAEVIEPFLEQVLKL